jgi:hypothetical protein
MRTPAQHDFGKHQQTHPCGFDSHGNPYGFDDDDDYFNQEAERRILDAHPNINPNQFKLIENE